MTISKGYNIAIPTYNTDIKNFNFTANINGINFYFEFQYFNDQWNGWVTFDNKTRLLGVIPYIMNWKTYYDYIIIFDSELDNIGQNDLINTSIKVLQWA